MIILHQHGANEILVQGSVNSFILSLSSAINSYNLTDDQIQDLQNDHDVFLANGSNVQEDNSNYYTVQKIKPKNDRAYYIFKDQYSKYLQEWDLYNAN